MPIKQPNYGKVTTQRPRRIVIQCNSPTRDAKANSVDNWSDVTGVWTISWQTLSGERNMREYFLGQQVKGSQSSIIRIRAIPSLLIKPGTHRIKYETRLGCRFFDINAAADVNEQGQFVEMLIKEATAA